MPLRNGWTRPVFINPVRATGLGVSPSSAFVVSGPPSEAVRAAWGGPVWRFLVERGVDILAHALATRPESAMS